MARGALILALFLVCLVGTLHQLSYLYDFIVYPDNPVRIENLAGAFLAAMLCSPACTALLVAVAVRRIGLAVTERRTAAALASMYLLVFALVLFLDYAGK